MSYTPFTPNIVDLLHLQGINSDPYVYDTNKFSLIEQVGILFERMNQNLQLLNLTQSEVLQFENYVLEQLQNYDEKVQEDVTNTLNLLISNGTIANLINQTLFNGINTSITNLTNTVAQNKSDIENTVAQNKTDIENTVAQNKSDVDTQISQIQQDILDINYTPPSLILSSSPSQLLYNLGESINSIILSFNITGGTNPLVKAEIYKNNTLIGTINTPLNGVNTFTDANIINQDTDYYIKLYDNKENINSNHLIYKFVNNYFYGISGENDTINASFILSLSSLKSLKSNLSESFNCNDNKIIFAYPNSYGDLVEILYKENNIIEAFTKSIIVINSTNYNVYVSNNFIYQNISLTFNVEV